MSATSQTLEETSWIGGTTAGLDLAQDSGLQSLIAAARVLGIAADAWQVWHLQSPPDGFFQEMDILRAARRLGLRAHSADISFKRLALTPVPAIVHESERSCFCMLQAITDQDVRLLLPDGQRFQLSHTEFEQRFQRRIILLAKAVPETEEEAKSFGVVYRSRSRLLAGPLGLTAALSRKQVARQLAII